MLPAAPLQQVCAVRVLVQPAAAIAALVQKALLKKSLRFWSMVFPFFYGIWIWFLTSWLQGQEPVQEQAADKLVDANVLALNSELPAYSKIGYTEMRNEAFEKTPKQSIRRFMYS